MTLPMPGTTYPEVGVAYLDAGHIEHSPYCECPLCIEPDPPAVLSYRHRPAPSGLHAKFLAELSERSPYIVKRDPNSGLPGSVWVVRENAHGPNDLQWSGHRDSMPRHFRGAADPNNLLTRPASD